MIEESKARNEAVKVHELARDGSRITQTIIKMVGYHSISGNYIRYKRVCALISLHRFRYDIGRQSKQYFRSNLKQKSVLTYKILYSYERKCISTIEYDISHI